MNNYGYLEDSKSLNWDEDLIWDTSQFPDEYYSEVMDTMYRPIGDSFDGKRLLDTKKLKFKYFWFDSESAVKGKGER
jgi:hypothetical protein